MQEFVVPLIAAGSTILGAALGGGLAMSADHLRSARDERSKLKQLRLQTYSRFLRAAQGHLDTSHQRIMTMGEISDRKEKGESTVDLDNELRRLEAFQFELKELLAELEILGPPLVLEAARNVEKTLDEYDSAFMPVLVDVMSLMHDGKPNPTKETKRHGADLARARDAIDNARALFSARAKEALHLPVDD